MLENAQIEGLNLQAYRGLLRLGFVIGTRLLEQRPDIAVSGS
jgi:hypothetical protein